jgi:hypothetical protein
MSKRVIFICTLILLMGFLAAWDMFVHLQSGRLYLNLGVLFIPIGIGLFLGMPSARTAAVVVFSLTYALCGLVLIASIFGQSSIQWLGVDHPLANGLPIVFVAVAIICSVTGLIHWTLYSQPFEEHLSEMQSKG